MAIGTAGFTAMLCVMTPEQEGLSPDSLAAIESPDTTPDERAGVASLKQVPLLNPGGVCCSGPQPRCRGS